MLRRRAVLGTPKCEKSVGRRGSAPDPAGGAYSAPPDPLAGGEGLRGGLCCPLPKNPTYNIVIVLVLCVCTHVYGKMHCYILLNVNMGPHSCIGGGLQLSSAGTVDLRALLLLALQLGRHCGKWKNSS